MARRLRTYLRTRRRNAGISQADLGRLAGFNRDSISDYERERRTVPARLVIAGEIIFGLRAHQLFPALYKSVQDDIGANAAALYEELRAVDSLLAEKKRRLIEGIPVHTKHIDL